jgi:2-methylisocitrate lyase-like PEP mutase family enzyme
VSDPRLASLAERAERLRALHHGSEPLILANAWDVASAEAIERAGSAAIATTSLAGDGTPFAELGES